MYTFDFIAKVKKLNRSLYLYMDTCGSVGGHKVSGLYLRNNRRKKRSMRKAGLNYAGGAERRFLDDEYSGQRDQFIIGIRLDWIPEYDWIDPVADKINALGWRTVVKQLINRGLVSKDRAKRLFTTSLGEYDFDHLNYDQKIDFFKLRNGDARS